MSCSSKRNSDIGSCNSTLVSRTNSFGGPECAFFLTRDATGAVGFANGSTTFVTVDGGGTPGNLSFVPRVGLFTEADSGFGGISCSIGSTLRTRAGLRALTSKALAARRSAGLVGAGGNGMVPLCMGLASPQCQAAFLRIFKPFTAFNTSSTWPGTFNPRHSSFRMPSAPIKKVLRSIPLTFLPYMILFLTTPNI